MKVLLYLEQRIEDGQTSEKTLNNENKALIEFAEDIVKTYGGSLSVMMTGDEQKKTYLREALARGCDEAVFLKLDTVDDRGFGRQIAREIQGKYNLILFGYRMLDSTTAYLAPQVAQILQIPYISMVDRFEITKDGAKIQRKEDHIIQEVHCYLPCVLAVGNRKNDGRALTVMNIMRACDKEIQIIETDRSDSAVCSPFTSVESEPFNSRKRKQEIYQTMQLDEAEGEKVIPVEAATDHILQIMKEKGIQW